MKCRVQVPEAAGPEWAFIEETMYQSTDESQDESLTGDAEIPAVDPETDEEGPISRKAQKVKVKGRKPVSRKPYITRTPTYRTHEVCFP